MNETQAERVMRLRRQYPMMEELDREDISFSFVPFEVRENIAMKLDTNLNGWKIVGEKMRIPTDVIAWITTHKNSVSNTLDMFDKYVHRANSLRLFRDALMEVGCEDALARLWQGWEQIKQNVRSAQKKEPVQHHDSSDRLNSYEFKSAPNNSFSTHPGTPCNPSCPPLPCNNHCNHGNPSCNHGNQPPMCNHGTFSSLPSTVPCRDCTYRLPQPKHYNGAVNGGMVRHHSNEQITSYSPHKHQRTSEWVAMHASSSPTMPQRPPITNHARGGAMVKTEPLERGMSSNSSGHQSMDSSCSGPMTSLNHGSNPSAYYGKDSLYFQQGTPLNTSGKEDLPSIKTFLPRKIKSEEDIYNVVSTKDIFEPMDTAAVATTDFGGKAANFPEHTPRAPEVKMEDVKEEPKPEPVTNFGAAAMSLRLDGPSEKLRTVPMSRQEIRRFENHGGISPQSSINSMRRYGSSEGKVESEEFNDQLRAVSVFVTHLYRHWDRHPQESRYSKCAVSLGRCLKENNFRIKMDVPNKDRVPPEEPSWQAWADRKFTLANYILVCLTPSYIDAVTATHIDDDSDMAAGITDNVLSTRYIYHLMQHEFEQNKSVNTRFIPILFSDDVDRRSFPAFLQTSRAYRWTQDFEDLFWRLSRPDHSVTNIMANQQG